MGFVRFIDSLISKYSRVLNPPRYPVLLLLHLLACGCSSSSSSQSRSPIVFPTASSPYTTTFQLTENPISEGGNWIGGQSAAGNLWGNIRTNKNMAFGASEPTQYGDPTAILTGTWNPAQTASGIIKIVSAPATCCHEVELRLRTTISSHQISGYEIICPVHASPTYGIQVVRWNGPNGQFVYIGGTAEALQCLNGEVLRAVASGTNPTTIQVYHNEKLVVTACDNGGSGSAGNCGGFSYSGPGKSAGPFISGNPGIGFYNNADDNWDSFGFSSFSAQDNPAN
jgi:hypothetical protein